MYNFSMLLDNQIFKNPEKRIEVLNNFLINNIEINEHIDGKKITELNGEELESIRNLLIKYNKKIVLLNCCTNISDYEHYKRIFRNAHMLGIENINVRYSENSYNENSYSENNYLEYFEIHLKKIIRLGKSYGIRVLIENNNTAPFTNDIEFTRICKDSGIDDIQIIFNPFEYVRLKKHPFFHVFYNSKLKNKILFLRINDGLYADGSPTLPGEGNAEIKEMASAILARGFKGYFSFTPYLISKNINCTEGIEGVNDTKSVINIYTNIINRFKTMLMEI